MASIYERRPVARGGRAGRAAATVLALLLSAGAFPATARADEEEDKRDARLEGYARQVSVEKGGTTGTYMLFLIASAVACGVLFKNSKRTHLD